MMNIEDRLGDEPYARMLNDPAVQVSEKLLHDAYTRGPKPGEITLTELQRVWGFGKTRIWQLVVRDKVIPARRDRFRWYVKIDDASSYKHSIKEGRPPKPKVRTGA